MKVFITVLFAFYMKLSFGQTPTKSGIDKDIILSGRLWSEGKVEESTKLHEKILKESKQISYSIGILESSVNIAGILIDRHEYKKSDFYIKIAEKENLIFKSKAYSDFINSLRGDRFSGVGLEAEAIAAYKKNLNSAPELAAAASANISVGFTNLKMPDSSLYYYKKAYQILVKENKEDTWRMLAIVCSNVSSFYLGDLTYNIDSSRLYLNRGLLFAKKSKSPDSYRAVYMAFGSMAIKNLKTDSAIFYYQKSLACAKQMKNQIDIRSLYLKLGSAYELKKHQGKQLEYLKLYQQISDSLSKLNNLPFVVESMANENKALIDQKKRQYAKIGIILAFSGLIIAVFFYLEFRKYKKKQRLVVEEKDGLLDSALKFKSQYEIDNLGVLLELAKAKDPAFFLKFNEFNAEFKDKLLKKYDSLSLNDVEFCAYLRMNFDTKEIAIYANMSVRAVEAKKYRIRKKMGLSSTDNINLQMMDI